MKAYDEILKNDGLSSYYAMADIDCDWEKFPDASMLVGIDKTLAKRIINLIDETPKGASFGFESNVVPGFQLILGYDMNSGLSDSFEAYEVEDASATIFEVEESAKHKDNDNEPYLEYNTYLDIYKTGVVFRAETESGPCKIEIPTDKFKSMMANAFNEDQKPRMM